MGTPASDWITANRSALNGRMNANFGCFMITMVVKIAAIAATSANIPGIKLCNVFPSLFIGIPAVIGANRKKNPPSKRRRENFLI